jgi:MerR family redox-sensitive transcriptional activator SoxR
MREYSIGLVAKRTGLPVSTIRYYDDCGLIQSNKNRSGHRRFSRAQIRRVAFIMAAQRFGFKLDEIKAQLDQLPNGRTPTAHDWHILSENFRHHLDQRISELTQLRDKLDGCIGCGCLSLDACAIYNTNDHHADKGPGAQNLFN